MKNKLYRSELLALLVLLWGNVWILKASATVYSHTKSTQDDFLLTQSIRGECRATNSRINIYRRPSTNSEIIGVVNANQEVTLAEDKGRNGWIAIESPGVGFVQTQYLKPNCENSAPKEECLSVKTDTFIHAERSINSQRFRVIRVGEEVSILEGEEQNGWMTLAKPQPGFVLSEHLTSCNPNNSPLNSAEIIESSLCRNFVSSQPEEFAVYERPTTNSSVRGQLLPQYTVILDSSTKFTTDAQGREWAKIVVPVEGWISNGFPDQGGINLKACSQS